MNPAQIAATLRRRAENSPRDGVLLRAAAELIDGAPACVTVDLNRNRAVLAGHVCRLCAREAEFLHTLVECHGYATFDQLADAIWGAGRTGVSHVQGALRQLARRLNQRIADTPCRIAPVRGRGYEIAERR